mmetsp:Transcript_24140/g.67129  ORF Transcript_24140/g.67129 Transcript_24140/m.67129 type:complete len:277 (-) Transcript_24140:215-1045(-)
MSLPARFIRVTRWEGSVRVLLSWMVAWPRNRLLEVMSATLVIPEDNSVLWTSSLLLDPARSQSSTCRSELREMTSSNPICWFHWGFTVSKMHEVARRVSPILRVAKGFVVSGLPVRFLALTTVIDSSPPSISSISGLWSSWRTRSTSYRFLCALACGSSGAALALHWSTELNAALPADSSILDRGRLLSRASKNSSSSSSTSTTGCGREERTFRESPLTVLLGIGHCWAVSTGLMPAECEEPGGCSRLPLPLRKDPSHRGVAFLRLAAPGIENIAP